jgi:membrane protease YdiL (CAAX protease family)
VDDLTPAGERPAEAPGPQPFGPPAGPIRFYEPQQSDPRRSPVTSWPAWTAPAALFGGLFLAIVGGLLLDIPAAAFGVKITSEHTPAGIVIADTFIQDIGFVCAAVYFAQLGGRTVAGWQFGLRRPGVGWGRAIRLLLLLLVAFVILSVAWSELVNPEKEKILEQLGSNEGTAPLLLSAGLTCVIAPMCEEFLFRGFIFTALRNWRGTLTAAVITGLVFGGVHVTSAPALDLVPLAALGFGLCLLYNRTGSLYPCMAAHSLNNSIAFAGLENWSFATGLLNAIAALAAITALILLARRAGLIGAEPRPAIP